MIILLVITLLALWFFVRWKNSRSQPSHTLGADNGRLADCPDSPNCVSTQASDSQHSINPIPFTQSADEVLARLEATIRAMPRTRIVNSNANYLHAEFSSLLLGFVDDVEIVIDRTNGLIHFRSASRIGESDLGANRARMEQIRQRFQGN